MKKLFLTTSFILIILSGITFGQNASFDRAPVNDNVKHSINYHNNIDGTTRGYGADGIGNNWYEIGSSGLRLIGPTGGLLHQGGDFDGSGTFYCTLSPSTLATVDTATGVEAVVAAITGVTSGQTITSMAWDASTNTMFLGSTNGTTSKLYTLNLFTGVATLVGTIGQPGLIALACNCDGDLYSVDIFGDNLWSINKTTGIGTAIGPLGFDVNFAQDADFDPADGTMYLAAYNNSTSSGQLRIVDLATGNTTLLWDWGFLEISDFGITGSCGAGCPVGAATNPFPVNGAINVPTNVNLGWTNGSGTTAVELWFGEFNNLQMIYDGPPISYYTLNNLEYNKNYYWKVICKNDTCEAFSYRWTFKTKWNQNWGNVFFDDFEEGTGNWIITNDGGTCVWDISSLSRPYQMPPTASGNVFAADADLCGSGTTLISTATIDHIFNFSNSIYLYIEFDNDWRILDADDEAHIEVSTNGGSTWIGVWDQVGVDLRNSHEMIDLSILIGHSDCIIRFRSVQPGWDWWWAVDNVFVYGECSTCLPPDHPSNLVAVASGFEQVQLNWQDNSSDENGFHLERKEGDSLSGNPYFLIANLSANVTSFFDTSVEDSVLYTYRISAFNNFGTSTYSNLAQVLVWVPVEFVSFSANVFNNNIELNWLTASELNNRGFEVERLKDYKIEKLQDWETTGFVEGKGTTTETQHYSFVDKNLSPGKYKYRLKQIDFDGSYEYLSVVEAEVQLPNKFVLEQNYPNPFNPVTKIKYAIPNVISTGGRNLFVSLKVYDVLGREVATLVNEQKQAGEYEIAFDAAKLSSGIYYYELKSGEFRSIKKMILLK